MPKHIGIVAVTAEGAALCYQTICAEGPAVLGPDRHPEVTLHAFSLNDYLPLAKAGDWERMGSLLLASAAKLGKAGADFLICPANTAHLAIDLIRDHSPLPWLHIAEEVASDAERRGLKRLLLLGTRALMEGPVYPPYLSRRGIAHEIPGSSDLARMNDIIFDELIFARFTGESRAYSQRLIREFGERGGDGVILGCTELPLLLPDAESPLPVLDSTRVLARAAIREAAKES
ncbi:MAG TPA: amino acid racemase [Acidobacteriota bacterium]|nr:amino acid racemase [Acidobacteriota bacterium]